MKLIKESITLSTKGKRALKENMKSKKLNETWAGMDVIDDIVDRAKLWISDGYEVDDAISNAINDGLIYTKDIIDLAEHYGVIDSGELIERFVDDLYNDIYSKINESSENVVESLDVYTNATELNGFIKEAVAGLQKDEEGTYYKRLGTTINDTELYLVIGFDTVDNYDREDLSTLVLDDTGKYAIVGKIAVNSDDLQSDYNWDWLMPYYENGDVWDTEVSFGKADDYTREAEEFIKQFNDMKNYNISDEGIITESLNEDWTWGSEKTQIADKMEKAFESMGNVITRDDFDEQFALACREILGIDNIWENTNKPISIEGKEENIFDIETDIRTILSLSGWETIFEGEDEGGLRKLNESLNEMLVDIDEDDIVEILVNRLKSRWTDDPVTIDLYEQMYQNYVDANVDIFQGHSVMEIVDNDYVNYCDVVSQGDENYDKLLELYDENGLGDVSTEDVGYSYIEAATFGKSGDIIFLCRV